MIGAELSAVTMIEACAGVLPHLGKLATAEHLNGALLTPHALSGTNRLSAARYQIGSPDVFEPIWLPASAVAWIAKLRLDTRPKRELSADWKAGFRVRIELPREVQVVRVLLVHRAPGTIPAQERVIQYFTAAPHAPQALMLSQFPDLTGLFLDIGEVGRIRAPHALEDMAAWVRRHRKVTTPPLVVSTGRVPGTPWVFSADRLAVAVAVEVDDGRR